MLDSEADAQTIYVYEIEDRPGVRLCLGVPPGQVRPALWIVQEGTPALILGRFNGPREMLIAVNFMTTLVETINRVITHYRRENGDDEGTPL